jgi:hypothetical protein
LSGRIRKLTDYFALSGISEVTSDLFNLVEKLSSLKRTVDNKQRARRSNNNGGEPSEKISTLQSKLVELQNEFRHGIDHNRGASDESNNNNNNNNDKQKPLSVSSSNWKIRLPLLLQDVSIASRNRLGRFYITVLDKLFTKAIDNIRSQSCDTMDNCMSVLVDLASKILKLHEDPNTNRYAARSAVENADIVFTTIGSAGSSIVQRSAFANQTRIVDNNKMHHYHHFNPKDDHDDDEVNVSDNEEEDADYEEPNPEHKLRYEDSKGFTTLLVDEAGQAQEVELLIPMKLGCQRLLLVGDPKQLPAMIVSPSARKAQFGRSLLERLMDRTPIHSSDSTPKASSSSSSSSSPTCRFLLNTQYRMAPDIVTFPNENFYDGKLVTLDGSTGTCAAWKRTHGSSRSDYRDHYFGASRLWVHVGDNLDPHNNSEGGNRFSGRETESMSSYYNESEALMICDMVSWFVDGSHSRLSPTDIVIIAM